jgi:hypothetical protein
MQAQATDIDNATGIMAEVMAGQGIELTDVAKLVPGHPSTAWRWITAGAAMPDGTRLKLEAVRCGGRWVTTKAALRRFLAALTAAYCKVDMAGAN